MGPEVSVCFYLVIGLGVAVAQWIGSDSRSEWIVLFQVLSAIVFWPIYVPLLLTRRNHQVVVGIPVSPASAADGARDGMTSLIVQVESELDAALRSLNGWAENLLGGEPNRIPELKTAWRQQAAHIRDLDRLLSQTSTDVPVEAAKDRQSISSSPANASNDTATGKAVESNPQADPGIQNPASFSAHEQSRRENLLKLRQLRRQMYDDLMATLAWVRELVTMIHLAKYSGAPASRALELVRQIAAAVEGLSSSHRATSQLE